MKITLLKCNREEYHFICTVIVDTRRGEFHHFLVQKLISHKSLNSSTEKAWAYFTDIH